MSHANFTKSLIPLRHLISITPADNTDLSHACRAIYVGASGDVKVTTVEGETVTLVGLSAGIFHPVHVLRVHSTDTTATDIVGGW